MSFESDQTAFREGLKVGIPSLFGIGAWGLVVGVAMIKAGLTVPQALGMTFLVFAGSAQLASLPLIAAHAPAWVIFATALVVNLRFVIFSAILAPHFAHLSWRTRAYLGYFSGDMSVVFFIQRFPGTGAEKGKLPYLQGLIMPNWASWQIGSVTGILLGSQVPMSWGLGFAGTLAILCIMLPLVMNKAALAGVAVAGAVAIAAVNFPYKLGLLIAVVLGMATAMAAEEWLEQRKFRLQNQAAEDVPTSEDH
ncbi:AzlC family ABC transporter permease [Undibacterium sp. Xuan67W]